MMPTLGIDRTDRNDEGWYEEREISGSKIKQMQWNLFRDTWVSYFIESGLNIFNDEIPLKHGAIKPGVFYFGRKG